MMGHVSGPMGSAEWREHWPTAGYASNDRSRQRHAGAVMNNAGTYQDLINNATRFQLLVDAVTDYAIYMLDPKGIVISWNSGAQRLKGYPAAEILGRHF